MGGSEEHATNLAVGLEQRGHPCSVVAVRRSVTVDRVGDNQKLRLNEANVPYAMPALMHWLHLFGCSLSFENSNPTSFTLTPIFRT